MGILVGGAAFSPISVPPKVNITYNSLPCRKIGPNKCRTVVSKFSGGNGHIDLSREQLKSQLEALQREADQTRQKANTTRARFMRLTEAVDKLQLQALVNVKAGKESAAIEMLLQKRKVMQALEKSKRRAELLDELLKKLGEAISEKEAQLIKILATSFEKDFGKDSEGPVRVVSSTESASFNIENAEDHFEPDGKKIDGNEKEPRTNMTGATESESQIIQEGDYKELLNSDCRIRYDHLLAVLKGIDSYQNFLIDLDQQIAEMETTLQVLHKFSSLLLEDEAERLSNRKVKATIEILEALQNARARIAVALSHGKTST